MQPRAPWWLPGLLGLGLAVVLLVWLDGSYALSLSIAKFFAFLMMVMAVAVFVVTAALLVWHTSGRVKLFYYCDPELAFDIFDRKLDLARLRKNTKAWYACAMYLVWVYNASGEALRGITLLRSIKPAGDDGAALVIYHGTMALLSWDTGNYSAFKRAYAAAAESAARINLSGRKYRKCRGYLVELAVREAVLKGDYTTPLEHYAKQMASLPFYNVYGKVTAAWLMAGIYHLTDNLDARNEQLQYVAKHGNKLSIAFLARERLANPTL